MTTPPPQGQAPYPPQGGYPPQGQAPYPPQGGFPPQGQAPYPPQPGAPYPPVPPQPKRKVSFKTIRAIVIVVAVAGLAIGGYIASQDDANTAKVGDCMHRGSGSDTNPDLEVVDCGSSKAQYVVLAKVKGKYLTEITASAKCEAEAKDFQYTYTESGKSDDFLLCLKDYKK
ncbi:hypothetical protein ACGFYV_11680 [Streptomyces sp. NPDC048297]|uniref:LppU/SCO3897 family protein n=1 Tax=Streptomyces sp. NPDC048297 TaxID=3365531 RepID=UPI00371D7729